jgi:two-component system sensor histidine kinase YesM
MQKKRRKKMYTVLFQSIAVLTLVLGLMQIVLLSVFFGGRYHRQMIDNLKNSLTASADFMASSFYNAKHSAYYLMYCDAAQDCLNLTGRVKSTDITKKRDTLADLLRVIGIQSTEDMYYTVIAVGDYAMNYTNIDSKNIQNISYNFHEKDWFRNFEQMTDARIHFYPNVSIDGFTKPEIEEFSSVHIYAIRSNTINTLQPNGYVLLQFSEKTLECLLGTLPDMTEDLLIADSNNNILYRSLNLLDADTLIAQSGAESGKIYRADNGIRYIPMRKEIPDLGWTIYCNVNAKSVTDSLRNVLLTCVLIQLLMLSCQLIVVLYVSKRISRPLHDIAEDVKRYHDGQLEIRSIDSTYDEVDTLVTAMNGLSKQLTDAREKAKQYKQLEQSTAFYALRQQVNPHFLYNTLEMIIGMATQKDFEAIIASCNRLSSMFRYSLSRETTVYLREEIRYVRNYLDILSFRTNGRIKGQIDFNESDGTIPIPKLILQPFIENSLKYGFDHRLKDCLIGIDVRHSEDGLYIDVWDNGSGFSKATLDDLNTSIQKLDSTDIPLTHIGIVNVFQRLRIIYEDSFSMAIENRPDGGAAIHLILPKEFPNMIF